MHISAMPATLHICMDIYLYLRTRGDAHQRYASCMRLAVLCEAELVGRMPMTDYSSQTHAIWLAAVRRLRARV